MTMPGPFSTSRPGPEAVPSLPLPRGEAEARRSQAGAQHAPVVITAGPGCLSIVYCPFYIVCVSRKAERNSAYFIDFIRELEELTWK